MSDHPGSNLLAESHNNPVDFSTTTNNSDTFDEIELRDQSGVMDSSGSANTGNQGSDHETRQGQGQGQGQEQEQEGLEEQEGSSSARTHLLPTGIRENAARRVHSIGRRFNILDRLFRRHQGNEVHGEGIDGVFSNLTAKPDGNAEREAELQNETLPSYDEAAADMAPSYYGMDINSPDLYFDEICVEGLPVGNLANLVWNMVVSLSFGFVGFLITYVLHTSHAAKQGSRFGLGVTFLNYAYSMVPNNVVSKIGKYNTLDRIEPSNPNSYDDLDLDSGPTTQDKFESNLSHGMEEKKQGIPFLAVFTGFLGAFIVVKSIIDYVKAKRMEKRFLAQDGV